MPKLGLKFDYVDGTTEQTQLRDFLLRHPQGYRTESHEQWVIETCLPSIAQDKRRALGWWTHGRMIGDAVIKPLVQLEVPTVELKNFRVAEMTGRDLAHFMLVQVEHEAQVILDDKGLIASGDNRLRVVLDTPSGSKAESFFRHNGFEVDDVRSLYEQGRTDTIMYKDLELVA